MAEEKKREVCGNQKKSVWDEMSVDEMKAVDVRKVDRDQLVDIRDVVIDQKLPKEERIRELVRQVGNPYCFRVGDTVVKVSFTENGKTIEDCMEHYLRTR